MSSMAYGQKIREKRKERQMSLNQLAEAIGKTPSFLSQIERGLADPSITSLRNIAEVLEVPIFYFLMDTEQPSPVVRKNQRKRIKSPGYKVTFELLTPDLNRQMEVVEFRLEPGAFTCEEPLSHPGEECTLVIQGKMKIIVGTETYYLEEGDTIYYYASIPHQIINVGEEDLLFVSSITPPGF